MFQLVGFGGGSGGAFAMRASIGRKVSTFNGSQSERDQAVSNCSADAPSASTAAFVKRLTIVEAFSWVKNFAIDVLVWCNLNHHLAVRRSNIRSGHCISQPEGPKSHERRNMKASRRSEAPTTRL
jgi:hypothetical protein